MSSFCSKSYSHFFSKKFQHICVSLDVNFNELLTNIVSFEQLGPDCVDVQDDQILCVSHKSEDTFWFGAGNLVTKTVMS